jgi:MFS family permease
LANFFSKFYLKAELPGSVVALYTNRIIQRIAVGLLGLFLPVFLFQKYQSINLVLIFYLFSFGLYLFLAAPGAILASRLTFKKALILSVIGGMLYYICFYLFDRNLLLFSILALIATNFDRMFYWVPYHSGFAKFTDKKTRGRTIALLSSASSLLSIALPVIAGFIIVQYGFNVLFLIVVLVYTSSMIPFFALPPIAEYYTFSYRQTWKILFHPRDRKILFTYMADGAENIVGAAIWPIFIWQLLKGDYQAMGIISSLIILVTILLKLIMGKYTDKFNKKKLLRYGTVLYSLGWLGKTIVQTSWHIFLASTYHNFSAVAMRTPYDTLMYEKAADAGHYVDEYTVLREMSLNIGRVLMILAMFVLFNFFGLNYAFILAAVAALFINLI